MDNAWKTDRDESGLVSKVDYMIFVFSKQYQLWRSPAYSAQLQVPTLDVLSHPLHLLFSNAGKRGKIKLCCVFENMKKMKA